MHGECVVTKKLKLTLDDPYNKGKTVASSVKELKLINAGNNL